MPDKLKNHTSPEVSKTALAVPSSAASASDILSILEKANRIASMTSLEDLLDQMLGLMIEVCRATNGTLYLLDRHTGELVFKVVKGEQAAHNLIGMRIKPGVGIVGASVQQARPIVIDDLAKDPRWYREIDPEKTAALHNAITLPLLVQGKPIGAVQIFNYACGELELLQVLGNRMASEVDKVMLLEQVQRSNQRLHALVEMLGQIGAILDRDQLLSLLTDLTSNLLDAERGSVFLADSTEGEGVRLLSRSSTELRQTPPGISPLNVGQASSVLARSMVAVPLRTRPITVGKERSLLEERLIGNLMALNKQHGDFDDEDTQLLEILASQASTVLQVAELYGKANELFLDFIKVLAATIDAKDPYTRGHSQRVSNISVSVAQQMGLTGDLLHDIRIGSLLHDIGKIGVSDHILVKPTRLTDKEYEQMKKHPGVGFTIMEQVHLLHNVLPAIVQHHERLDGTGYPLGLRGEQISLMGRIVAVADVFDALSTDRPYREALDLVSVFTYLEKNTGLQFDGDCVQALRDSYSDDGSHPER